MLLDGLSPWSRSQEPAASFLNATDTWCSYGKAKKSPVEPRSLLLHDFFAMRNWNIDSNCKILLYVLSSVNLQQPSTTNMLVA